jgi:CheY-like chemotaxis protein
MSGTVVENAVEQIQAASDARHPIGSGADRRRRFRAKMVGRVHVRGALGTLDAYEDMGKSVDVTRDGILLSTTRSGYWVGESLHITFPYWSGPTGINMARRAKVVRNLRTADFHYAVAVEFEQQDGKQGLWVNSLGTNRAIVTVLGVESCPRTADAIRELLEKDGYHAVFVSTAQKALDIMQNEIPDVLLAEAEGALISGWNLCAIVKRNERLKHIPVILLTTSAMPSDYSASRRAGAIMCMMKPCEPGRLQRAIHLVAPPPNHQSAYSSPYNITSLMRTI